MSVTYGFYNAVYQNGEYDREYTAEQMSAIFDGLVNDGVYESIGERFAVTASSGMTVTVGSGRAWFDHTWTLNDAPINITLANADASLDRIDAIVIETNAGDRVNSITVVQGALSSQPDKPTLTSNQHPIAYLSIIHQSTEITTSQIENTVGTSSCPFVTGIVQVMSIDQIVDQWSSQWNDWLVEHIAEYEAAYEDLETAISQAWSGVISDNSIGLEKLTSAVRNTITNKVLYFQNVPCGIGTGDFVSITDNAITPDHVVSECVFSDPSFITTDVEWVTSAGELVLNGNCSAQTTVNLVLVKKDN